MNASILNNLPHFISWDFLMVLILFAVFITLGFFWKKKRILVIVLSLYLARLFLYLFPLPEKLSSLELGDLSGELIIFWAMFLILFLVFASSGISLRVVSSKRVKKRKKSKYLAIKGAFYGFFAAGLFTSFSLSLMSANFLENLSLIVALLFIQGLARIIWAILPLVAMMISK